MSDSPFEAPRSGGPTETSAASRVFCARRSGSSGSPLGTRHSVLSFRPAILAAALSLTLLFCSVPAFSQGCAMCYSTASAASKDGQHAISRGVLVLLIPPLGFMTIGLSLAYRYSRRRDLEQNQ